MIQLFYVVWAVLAVIVAAAFTWLAFKPQPEAPVSATKTNKPPRKQRVPLPRTVTPTTRNNLPETPTNDEELLQWSGIQQQQQQAATSVKVSSKVETAKAEPKKESKDKAESKDATPEAPKAESKERVLQKELKEIVDKLNKVNRKDLATLHNKQSKDNISKQEKHNAKLEQRYNERLHKLEEELKAVKANKNIAIVSTRDSLNQHNYAKNTESTLQAKLDALHNSAIAFEKDIRNAEDEIARLENGQDGSSQELEEAVQLNQQLEQENKELRDRLSLSHHVSASSDDVKKLTDALTALREELAKANKDLQALTAQHQATKGALSKAKSELSARSSGEDVVESLTSQLSDVEKHNKALAANVHKERQRISTASTTLAEKNKELKSKIASSTEEIENLKKQIEQAQQELSA